MLMDIVYIYIVISLSLSLCIYYVSVCDYMLPILITVIYLGLVNFIDVVTTVLMDCRNIELEY